MTVSSSSTQSHCTCCSSAAHQSLALPVLSSATNTDHYTVTAIYAIYEHLTGASNHSVLSLGSGKADLISTIFRPLSPAPGLSSSKRPSPFEKSSADSGAASSSSGAGGSTLTPRTLKRNTAVDAFFSGAADKVSC
jgi:hypothetical protein